MDSDFVVGINKSIDAAKGETGKTYPAYLHNTLVTEKLDELASAISEGGGGGGASALADLTDVDISGSVQGGKVLKYNAVEEKWAPGDDSGNVQSDWNESDSSSGAYILNKPSIPSNIDDLSDVDLTNIQDGMVLKYDNATLMFKAGLLYIEILQADYDNLTYDQKHNGIPYFITDGESSGGGGSFIPTVELTPQTLVAGHTSVTFTNAAITTSCTIDIYTDPEIPHDPITVDTDGEVTIYFDAQSTDVAVKVRIS